MFEKASFWYVVMIEDVYEALGDETPIGSKLKMVMF